MTKDYYKILGVTEFDTPENIKSAYRKLARQYHPDVAGQTASILTKFKEINEAYEVLSNRVKKDEYDRALKFYNYAKENSSRTGYTQKNSNAEDDINRNTDESSFDWKNIFNFNKWQKNCSQHKQVKNGENVYTDVELTYQEALVGTTKTLNILQTRVCSKCHGHKFANGMICEYCHGSGEQTSFKKLTVKIPAGIKNGSKIRLSGEGGLGKNGGASGDLYINIHVKSNDSTRIVGLNILKNIVITPYEAVLGATKVISTPQGDAKIKVLPMTQNGQKIRLNGYGVVQNEKVGDMILNIEIQIPQTLSNEEIELYKKLEHISKGN